MEEQGTRTPTAAQRTAPRRGKDLLLVLTLMALAAGLRAWQVRHTEVVSRDCISYVRIAWDLEHGDWLRVIPSSPQHPLYPAAVLGMSIPVRRLIADLPSAMQLSAQLASALASVLLVVPMFYLGRELFDRRVAFWAAALFQTLPASGRVMADGLSEPLFLLWAAAALLFAVRGLRTGSAISLALSGLAAGLAYLTRPEGIAVAAVTGLVLLAGQAVHRWRRPWGRVLKGAAGLTAATLVVVVPFMCLIGGFTLKMAGAKILDQGDHHCPYLKQTQAAPSPAAASPAVFAVWYNGVDGGPATRYDWGAKALAVELVKCFGYVGWVPALLGLWWFRDRFRLVQGAWVLLLVSLLILAALYRLAVVMGYLSDRHALLVLLCASYWLVAAVGLLGRLLPALLLRPARPSAWASGRAWSAGLLLLLTVAPLGRTMQTLHGERKGFRKVGCWLAQHTLPGDAVFDPYCWAHYYAGRVFHPAGTGQPAHSPLWIYVVIDKSKSEHPHLWDVATAYRLARGKQPVYQYTFGSGRHRTTVEVYEVRTP